MTFPHMLTQNLLRLSGHARRSRKRLKDSVKTLLLQSQLCAACAGQEGLNPPHEQNKVQDLLEKTSTGGIQRNHLFKPIVTA